jgi:hypothetical protein
LVLPNRWALPGSQFSRVKATSSSIVAWMSSSSSGGTRSSASARCSSTRRVFCSFCRAVKSGGRSHRSNHGR